MGCAGLPCTLMARPFSTVVSKEQVSGQSCGQAPRTTEMAVSVIRPLWRRSASGQTLAKLRLPAAMPFIFNALKINSTLAMIGAIVAEFFGTPIVGMGFRISTEVGKLGLDMVWAEIAMAAITGSAFYGLLVFLERRVTFWHPSYRK